MNRRTYTIASVLHLNIKPLLVLTLALSVNFEIAAQNQQHSGPTSKADDPRSAGNGSLPTGSWRCVYAFDNHVNGTTRFTNTITIAAGGSTTFHCVHESAYKPGWHFGYGKFQGLHKITWTTFFGGCRAVRVGDEIYVYPGKGDDKLIAGDPPGYSLIDYETLGGVAAKQPKQVTIDVYKIYGDDLILVDSGDKRQWTYKRVVMR